MKFRIVSHSCMQVEAGGGKLLMDPWIVGSVYWRSWWHFPEVVGTTEELCQADWVYLTHQHFDHFHYPSLRHFKRDTTILLPYRATTGMESEIRGLGFTDVVSMPHGKPLVLNDNLKLVSYQGGWMDDSALVIQADGTTMLNLNDCRLEDAVMDRILRRHGPIDFVFRSHSSAQAYPDCYTSTLRQDLEHRMPGDYIRDFVNAARRCRARYAIPFASNVCFLHPETIEKNAAVVDPNEVVKRFRERAEPGDGEAVVMLPGATWDSREGFALTPTDIFARRDEELRRLAEKYREAIASQTEIERNKKLEYSTFEAYMTRFLESLPWFMRFTFRRRYAYVVPGAPTEWWILDTGTRKITRTTEKPTDVVSISRVTPGLLQDAIEKGIVNFIDISKRLHVELNPGKAIDHFVYRELMTLFEQGYFPLWKNFTPRFVGVWLRRYLEVLSYARKALGGVKSFIPAVGAVKPEGTPPR
jgi:UDP-MurNAc hydroxylase